MKCPLLGTMGMEGKIKPEWADCLRDQCAWWSATKKSCVVAVVAAQLTTLALAGENIVDRMPSEKHFGR